METYHLEQDVNIVCVTAESFPEGILAAHQKLHAIIPYSKDRKYYGISRPNEQRTVIYKAAAEAMNETEAENPVLETFTLKKGEYISMLIKDYMSDIPAIGNAFQQLLTDPRIDPNGACIEWYLSDKDVQCMVRLDDALL